MKTKPSTSVESSIMKIYIPHPNLSNPLQRFLILLLLILLLLILVVTTGAAQTEGKSLIDKLATEYVSDTRNHALTIGITRNGKQEVFTFGENERGEGQKPSPNAIFELGTTSEVFTTSLLAILESEGKISSLDAVADALSRRYWNENFRISRKRTRYSFYSLNYSV